jgi:hypothetical protein
MLAADSPLFGEGWVAQNGEWKTRGAESLIYVPMFTKDKPRFRVEFHFKPTEQARDLWIDFSMNGKFLKARKVPFDGSPVALPVRSRDYKNEMNTLALHVYRSRSDRTAPQLVLGRIHFQAPDGSQLMDDEP